MPNCYAQESPTYRPAMRIINAITRAATAQITTSFAHNYIDGLIVRILVPDRWGMRQINNQTGVVTVVDATNFTIPINSSNYDALAAPATPYLCPQVVPIGELTSQLTGALQNVL
jgi:hypothetical protein